MGLNVQEIVIEQYLRFFRAEIQQSVLFGVKQGKN